MAFQRAHGTNVKIFGVNYGNRFIPEEWMMSESKSRDFFHGIQPGGQEPNCKTSRVSLCDVTDSARMFQWLEHTIQEHDFQRMRDMGVQLVRVPCGYWNWVSYPSDTAPCAPDKRLGNLHKLGSPAQYEPYFHRIFDYAGKYGIKVLLDLHGAPGSQNGQMHSGACLPKSYFVKSGNYLKALEAISNMAAFASRKTNFFGLQVLNEPQNMPMAFLEAYYKKAIVAARRHLAPEIPVILFTWSYDMEYWRNDHFEQKQYGTILWDTHVYHFPEEGEIWTTSTGGLSKAKAAYEEDLQAIKDFHRRQSGGCIVGEFSLAGPTLNAVQNCQLAKWLVTQFCSACHGCVFWNYDGPAISEWNMSKSALAFGINWLALASSIRAPFLPEPTEKLAKQASFQPPRAGHSAPFPTNLGQKSWLPPMHLQQLVHKASQAFAISPVMTMTVQHLPLYKLHVFSLTGDCIATAR
mmetsp:Transcript_48237/g.86981  ORF Transcript_48237/g.86981 Transcript_48237/m.86981 type:complete len:464 (+) Transcript_48237:94-1485(+)